jgi:ABC-type Zn uptake system ZnuABC Zn-binding protein ZnuA
MRYQLRFVALLVLAAGLTALTGCDRRAESGSNSSTQPAAAASGRPVIVVSIHPVASLVSQLVDDWGQVHTLLPPGASEHSTDLPPEAVTKLADADVLVIVGLGLDDWLAERAETVAKKKLRVLRFAELAGAATQPAERDGHDHEGHDHSGGAAQGEHDHHDHSGGAPNAHLWLDPAATSRFVKNLGVRLEGLMPEHGQALRNRVRLMHDRLGYLDADYRGKLARVPNKKLVTFHNAFDPLAERYGLEVVAHLTEPGVDSSGEVTPRKLAEAIQAIREHDLPVVYAEPQFPDAAAESIREQTGVTVLRLDPLGDPKTEGYRTYEEMMRSNLQTLVEGQSMKR